MYHGPYQKGLDHFYLHVYACLLLCFMLVLASLVISFAMFGALCGLDLVRLHPMPMRPCSDVTIWEASPDAGLLRVYPCLFHSTRCYVYHACLCHLLAFYASLHAFLHVHARVLLASMSSILQHNKVLDIRSKPTFVPPQTPSLICLLSCLIASFFVCLIVRLLILLLVMSPATCYTCFACMLVYFIPILHYLHISFFHCLSAGFLSLPLHVHTWSKDAWS